MNNNIKSHFSSAPATRNLLFLREYYSCLHDCWSPAKVSQFLALTTVRKIESSAPQGLAFLLQPEWAPFHVLLGINFISFNLFLVKLP